MLSSDLLGPDDPAVDLASRNADNSAVSWAAIFAGAAGATALSLILLVLGVGLGFSAASPWADRGASATTLGASSIVWIGFVQLAASGIGGYIAGRLRARWADTHRDEVYFRDTAHGFLAWAVATLVTAAMLTSAVGSIVTGAARAGASIVSGAAGAGAVAATGAVATFAPRMADAASSNAGAMDPAGYFVDTLFRRSPDAAASTPSVNAAPAPEASQASAEVARIVAYSTAGGSMSAQDTQYVGTS